MENEGIFAIHEAYYNAAGEVMTITVEPVASRGDSLAELRADLDLYLKA